MESLGEKQHTDLCALNVSCTKLILPCVHLFSFKADWSDILVIINIILSALSSGTNFKISKQTMCIIFPLTYAFCLFDKEFQAFCI